MTDEHPQPESLTSPNPEPQMNKIESARQAGIAAARKRNAAPTDSMPVLQELRLIRASKGLTQTQIGKICGYSQNHIALVELGRTMPSLYFLRDYAQALGYRLTITPLEKEEG